MTLLFFRSLVFRVRINQNLTARIMFMVAFVMSMTGTHSGQHIQIGDGTNVTRSRGNDLFPSWSPDATRLVFQTDRNGNWDLMILDVQEDTAFYLVRSPEDERHPVWIRDGGAVGYDAGNGDGRRLHIAEPGSGNSSPMFDRNLMARQPSFTDGEKLVYFAGFDDIEKQWLLYSYEFGYNTLNKLKQGTGEHIGPKVSPDDDLVLFAYRPEGIYRNQLNLVSWYGNPLEEITAFDILDPTWAPEGLKIIFISTHDHPAGEVYSIWKDGTHLERLTHDSLEVRTPVMSPDGRYLAVAVRHESGFDIHILPLEDY